MTSTPSLATVAIRVRIRASTISVTPWTFRHPSFPTPSPPTWATELAGMGLTKELSMSDIDIERLREAMGWLDDYAWHLRRVDGITLAPLEDVGAAVLFLVSLADQGGELILEQRCEHGSDGDCYALTHGLGRYCDGGSRVRIWPPTEGGGE